MPYIKQERREVIQAAYNAGEDLPLENAGELAWVISGCMEAYRTRHGDSFQTFAEIDAAARASIREFERVVIGPYEDAKAILNGPVFGRVLPVS